MFIITWYIYVEYDFIYNTFAILTFPLPLNYWTIVFIYYLL